MHAAESHSRLNTHGTGNGRRSGSALGYASRLDRGSRGSATAASVIVAPELLERFDHHDRVTTDHHHANVVLLARRHLRWRDMPRLGHSGRRCAQRARGRVARRASATQKSAFAVLGRTCSTVSSNTRFMNWSKPRSNPVTVRFPFNLTATNKKRGA